MKTPIKEEVLSTNKIAEKKELSLWKVYCICLAISTIFFFLFGFNSPIYAFNSDPDYQWFMTLGNGFVHGKIPYRDLFEQKGPIVYFVTAFCCLFPTPRLMMLIIEIFSISLFFFFAYRICRKHLNTFYSLIAVLILAFAIFTSWCRIFRSCTVEEFMLPIYAYFLLCWLEFLQEKRAWTWIRSLCLGLCFGVMLWVKYTLFYFMLTPMIIWLILSLRRRQIKTLTLNALWMIAGVLIITAPVLIFYALHHALDDLIYCYFYINLTAYRTNDPKAILKTFILFFEIGPALLIIILASIFFFTKLNWQNSGQLLLIAFIVNISLIILSSIESVYYYGQLIPYGILGTLYILTWIQSKYNLLYHHKLIYVIIIFLLIIVSLPLSPLTSQELGRNKNEYTPLVLTKKINEYSIANNINKTLLCYNIVEYGFYNASEIIPTTYYFAKNGLQKSHFPQMTKEFKSYIENQTCNFVITGYWIYEQEKDFLSQYYSPITGYIESSKYHYSKLNYRKHIDLDFILLVRK